MAKRARPTPASTKPKPRGLAGSQTLTRGLDLLEAVAHGQGKATDLAASLDLTRSTAHRLASALVERGYLRFMPRLGYELGQKLLELGFLARNQMSLLRIARPHLEALSASASDTVHLGVLDGERALYLDKVPGSRRVEISSRLGERQPLRSTGIGKALILDETESRWRDMFDFEEHGSKRSVADINSWLRRMRDYAKRGYAFDLEENEDRIRCVAAPIRDVSGAIVASISVASAAQYMDDARMLTLADEVKRTADAISRDLGWREKRR